MEPLQGLRRTNRAKLAPFSQGNIAQTIPTHADGMGDFWRGNMRHRAGFGLDHPRLAYGTGLVPDKGGNRAAHIYIGTSSNPRARLARASLTVASAVVDTLE